MSRVDDRGVTIAFILHDLIAASPPEAELTATDGVRAVTAVLGRPLTYDEEKEVKSCWDLLVAGRRFIASNMELLRRLAN